MPDDYAPSLYEDFAEDLGIEEVPVLDGDYTPDLGILVQRSITLLQKNCPPEGYLGAFSGGKDSCVIKELAGMAGVPVTWHYHQTTIDPPELVHFIRKYHADVIWDKPRRGNFFRRAEVKGFPTRVARWCCDEYKEGSNVDRPVILGIRIAESANRKTRWTNCVMTHFRANVPTVLPIRLWSDKNIWEFIHWRQIPYCSLYDEGFDRLGCVGCPLASVQHRKFEFKRWPGFEKQWRLLFARVWARRHGSIQRDGRTWFGDLFNGPDELFNWWNDGQPNITEWLEAHGSIAKPLDYIPFDEVPDDG